MPSRLTRHVPRFFWPLVLTLLIAAGLRLWQIGTLPPGLHYDEAADTIIAQQIARGESAPIFVAAYTGKEVLFFYWAALWMKLIGPSVFAMRLAAAMLGVLTVAVTYWTVRELFAVPLTQRRRGFGVEGVMLLATMFIATSFWHVLMSRIGFRSIAEPFIQALALAALFRGLRLNRWGWIIAAGALIGLNLYTYLAARLFPVAIAAIFFFLIAFDRGQRNRRIGQFVVVALTALIVFAPLGGYFLNHPDAFLTRIQQVAPRSDQATALLGNVGRALGMFFLSGDPYIRFNLPYRPLFSFVWGVLFVIGLIAALVGVIRSRTIWRKTAYFSAIAVTLIMLLPTALAVNEITPSNLRAIGMMPLVFVFPALGTWWVIQRTWVLIRVDRRRLVLPVAFSAMLIVSTIEASVVYFAQYVHEPQLYVQSDGDLADIAQWLNTHDTHGEPVYLAALHYRHPTVAALSPKFDEVKWIAGNRGIVLPKGPGYLFFGRLGLPDEQWLQRVLPDAALIAQPLAPDGATNYRLYHLTAQPVVTPQVKLNVNFGNIVQLIGYDVLTSTAGAPSNGSTASVTLYWQVLNKPDRNDYATFAQLRDAHGFEWGKGGSFDYPSEQWTPGEIIVNRIDVPISAGAPPGDYELRVGWFSPETQQRINVVAPDGGFGGTVARLAPISIDQITTAGSPLNIGTRLDWNVMPGLRLLGYTQPITEAQTGAPIDVTLYWQSAAPLSDEPVTLQLASCGCANQPVTTTVLTTTVPAQGTYPFNRWQPGEVVADRYHLRVPFSVASGDYTLEVAVGDGEPIVLGAVNVWRGNRVMEEPPIQHPMNVILGDAIELAGYNLEQTSDAIKLTLIWKSLHTIDEDYTVFTHMLDQSGRQIAGEDNQPVNGTYPTSHWMPGEYVSDEYTIPITSKEFEIEVGLYDPETGARLGETIRLK
ncbi:MAG TPA: glycosyltransferase family 39 protein [Anaerolineae bacterium]|nr:glycosyltransferase family 39 protein [Anaerolineae bacterium]